MKQNIVIDPNNPYVQALIQVINQFMLEEATGCSFTQVRLKNKVEQLQKIFSDERRRMVIGDTVPVFGKPSLDKCKLVFKQN